MRANLSTALRAGAVFVVVAVLLGGVYFATSGSALRAVSSISGADTKEVAVPADARREVEAHDRASRDRERQLADSAAADQAKGRAAARASEAAAAAKAADEAAKAKAKKTTGSSGGGSGTPGAPVGPVPTSCKEYSGNKQTGCTLMIAAGYKIDQMPCLEKLWDHESGWNHRSSNSSSGAYGIPQALPGSKMASHGDDWQTNPATQIRWGLSYIKGRYSTPCGAWGHFQSNGWY